MRRTPPDYKNDLGVISPTAAISAMPYTPKQSMAAIRYWYDDLGGRIWGKYGFYDAFSQQPSGIRRAIWPSIRAPEVR